MLGLFLSEALTELQLAEFHDNCVKITLIVTINWTSNSNSAAPLSIATVNLSVCLDMTQKRLNADSSCPLTPATPLFGSCLKAFPSYPQTLSVLLNIADIMLRNFFLTPRSWSQISFILLVFISSVYQT